ANTVDIDVWCSDGLTLKKKTGFEAGEASVTMYPQPDLERDKRFFDLSKSLDADGPEVTFSLGWSNGKQAPEVNTAGDDFDYSNITDGRTFFQFDGWISSFPFDFSGDLVETQMGIVRTSMGKWVSN